MNLTVTRNGPARLEPGERGVRVDGSLGVPEVDQFDRTRAINHDILLDGPTQVAVIDVSRFELGRLAELRVLPPDPGIALAHLAVPDPTEMMPQMAHGQIEHLGRLAHRRAPDEMCSCDTAHGVDSHVMDWRVALGSGSFAGYRFPADVITKPITGTRQSICQTQQHLQAPWRRAVLTDSMARWSPSSCWPSRVFEDLRSVDCYDDEGRPRDGPLGDYPRVLIANPSLGATPQISTVESGVCRCGTGTRVIGGRTPPVFSATRSRNASVSH